MIFGLLRLGFHERGAFGLGRLLWKQVGYWCFSLIVVFSAYTAARIHKGVIWLLVATIAEVPPAVSGQTCVPLLFAHRDIMSKVFLSLNLNSRFTLFFIYYVNADWTPNIRSVQPCAFLFFYSCR